MDKSAGAVIPVGILVAKHNNTPQGWHKCRSLEAVKNWITDVEAAFGPTWWNDHSGSVKITGMVHVVVPHAISDMSLVDVCMEVDQEWWEQMVKNTPQEVWE
jgi:hypothetical protein